MTDTTRHPDARRAVWSSGDPVLSETVRITDQGRLRVAVLHPGNNNLYIATDADPGRILRVVPG